MGKRHVHKWALVETYIFLPTLSVKRAAKRDNGNNALNVFLSTFSIPRMTGTDTGGRRINVVSTRTLRKESDHMVKHNVPNCG